MYYFTDGAGLYVVQSSDAEAGVEAVTELPGEESSGNLLYCNATSTEEHTFTVTRLSWED